MYEDDQSSEGGPKSSFETYRAEGDVLFKQAAYKKAIESYNLALDMRPEDKNCLVARSRCNLQLGDAEAALADAEKTLEDDKNFIRGLLQKAEALYLKGEFEMALVNYHRGHKLRSEIQEFKLGIQKCQEAIDNSIGDPSMVKLENKGDLSFFTKQDEIVKPPGTAQSESRSATTADKKKKQKNQAGGYSKPNKKKEEKKERERPKHAKNDKTVKQLLGELYADALYLDKFLDELGTKDKDKRTETDEAIYNLCLDAREYLDTRTDFWRQQKPMYARKRDKQIREQRKDNSDPTRYILKNLEEIDQSQAEGRYDDSLKQCKKVLKTVEGWSDDDVNNKHELVANLHSCMGNAYLEMGDYKKSQSHHNKDLKIGEANDIDDAVSRALDNLGRVYARMGQFEKAIDVWEKKRPLSKSAIESTWLFHEIGRCHLELQHYQEAKDYGEKSMEAANEADDDVWQLNASVLVAQAEVKLGDLEAAVESFERSLEMAKVQGDTAAEKAIKKALEDVNQRIVQSMRDDQEGSESGKKAVKENGSEKGSQKGDDSYEDDDFEEEDQAAAGDNKTDNGTDDSEKQTEKEEDEEEAKKDEDDGKEVVKEGASGASESEAEKPDKDKGEGSTEKGVADDKAKEKDDDKEQAVKN